MEEKTPTELIVRYLSNETTPEESERLHDWVSASHEHQKIFTEWMEAWNHKVSLPNPYNLDNGLHNLHKRISAMEKATPAHTGRPLRVYAIAAAVALLVAFALYYIPSFFRHASPVVYAQWRTPAGIIDTVLLSDGSSVILNENTLLRYPEKFDESLREVMLEGEAFFDVAKDSLRPFVVRTQNISTRVLGTSFNICTRPSAIAVSVVTGRVRVSDPAQEVTLLPHEKATYWQHTQTLQKEAADLATELAWRQPVLAFHDTPLADVALRLQKHYGVTVSFETDALKKCPFTGTFKRSSLSTILAAIAFSTGVEYRQTDGHLKFLGKGCHP